MEDSKPLKQQHQSLIERLKEKDYTIQQDYTIGRQRLQLISFAEQTAMLVELSKAYQVLIRLVDHHGRDLKIELVDKAHGFRLNVSTSLGLHVIHVHWALEPNFQIHYRVQFTPSATTYFEGSQAELLVLYNDYSVPQAPTIFSKQKGGRSGICSCSFKRPSKGTLFYFQNLSAVQAYAEACEVTLMDSVSVAWPALGFALPQSLDQPLQANTSYDICDAYLIFENESYRSSHDVAMQFLRHQYQIYQKLDKPMVVLENVLEMIQKGATDLCKNHGCWQQVEADAYLNAYVNDYENPAESMVQLAVLWPLQAFHKKYPKQETEEIINNIVKGIPRFYDEKLRSLVRWIPQKEYLLDHSEEHKKPRIMDAWYLHHPLLNLAFVLSGGYGTPELETLFFESVNFCTKVAQAFDYQWPVFYDLDTLDIKKAESAPGKGGERDVPGLYAFLQLRAYELSKKKKHLNEAKRAANALLDLGNNILYQANNTAYAAEAMLEIWHITKEEKYLHLSEMCIAHLLRNTALWAMTYGNAKEYPSFFTMYPLSDAPYAALFEEEECLASFNRYVKLVHQYRAPVANEIKVLLPEYTKYMLGRMPYYFPPMLPPDVIAPTPKTGYINKELWIPVEDLGDGWEPIGSVGQEVYGCGGMFYVALHHLHQLANDKNFCYIGYPVLESKRTEKSFTFLLAGSSANRCPIRIIGAENNNFRIYWNDKSETLDSDKNTTEVYGGQEVTIKWN
ncbi:hypothetical protein [Sphingobacterium deserti]|uniref:Uncharacterized protein n=1 Tax=Sphingobacterium deserti TaxID=1229276 RepID=A0A0B8T554_9SPHI|nr:hypothetical protein [Sphingobacterium deserti]KGE12569.1 hypothetical protein DI53_3609 [Sphingobacterium deserti]